MRTSSDKLCETAPRGRPPCEREPETPSELQTRHASPDFSARSLLACVFQEPSKISKAVEIL